MKNWFLQKNDSDQKIIVILAALSVLLLFYTFIYLPITRTNAQLNSSIADIQTEITEMNHLAQQAKMLTPTIQARMTMEDSQMMTLIEQVAKQQQISLSDIKSQSKNKILVSLNKVSFNAAIRWLDILQTQYQTKIAQFKVESEKKGLANITVTLSH